MEPREKLEIFKERYYFEHDRHEKLTSRLGIPITVLTFIFGILTFYLNSILPFELSLWFMVFSILSALVIIFVIMTVFHLIRSYYNYEYSYFPLPFDLKRDLDNIIEYYGNSYFNNLTQSDKERRIDKDIDELLLNYYIEAANNNTKNNDTKSKHLHLAFSNLIIAIIFLILSSVPFLVIKSFSKENTKKEKVINLNIGGYNVKQRK